MRISRTTNLFGKGHGMPCPCGRAFTIVEMLVVVVLIALLASTGGGYMVGTYKRMLVEKAAKQVYLAAKYARLLAVERQRTCRLIIDEEGGSFLLAVDAVETLDEEEYQGTEVRDSFVKPVELTGDVAFKSVVISSSAAMGDVSQEASDQSFVGFYPDGTADAAVIEIGDERSTYVVYVLAATGKAQVRFGEADVAPVDVIDLDLEAQ